MIIKNEVLKFTWKTFFKSTILSRNFFLLPRLETVETVMRAFQCKVLHNAHFLNQNLFLFHKVVSPLCSFCDREDETVTHLFQSCSFTSILWKKTQKRFPLNIFELPDLILQSAIIVFLDPNHQNYLIINHLLVIFKVYIYKLILRPLKRREGKHL